MSSHDSVSEAYRRGLHVFLLGVLSFVRSTSNHALDWASIVSVLGPEEMKKNGGMSAELAVQIWRELFSNARLENTASDEPVGDASDPRLDAPSPEQLSEILQNLDEPLKQALSSLHSCARNLDAGRPGGKVVKRASQDEPTSPPLPGPSASKRARAAAAASARVTPVRQPRGTRGAPSARGAARGP